MRKLAWLVALAAVLASCGGGSGDRILPLPPGVYVAGVIYQNGPERKACYWHGSRRIVLEGAIAGSVEYISVSGDMVLVKSQDCYWANGVRHEITGADKIKVAAYGGKVYKLQNSELLVDGSLKIDFSAYGFYPKDFAIHNGDVYIAGIFLDEGSTVACYYVWDRMGLERRDIAANTDKFSFIPGTVAVAGSGNVFVVGSGGADYGHDNSWLYDGGAFTELFEYGGHGTAKRILEYDGRVWVFNGPRTEADLLDGISYFFVWINGWPIPVIDENNAGSFIEDICASGGLLCSAGSQYNFARSEFQAWCSFGGVRYYLDGSSATAIFIAE